MRTLLVITNSVDGTADILVDLSRQAETQIFRWNVDLWRHYDLRVSNEECLISDASGRTANLSCENIFLLWRKPFVDLMDFEGLAIGKDDQLAAQNQIGQWLYAVAALFMSERRARLVEPYADRRLPKLFQLSRAQKYFKVPTYEFSVGAAVRIGPDVVAKPLGDPQIGREKIFYTSIANESELFRPYPWFVQEPLIGGADVTCVYINGKCYFFECGFKRDETAIDWRTEINNPKQSKWREMTGSQVDKWREAVLSYMKDLRLHYGRLDFILKNGELNFLECNSNGQFGWLDNENTHELHSVFFNAALDPRTAIGN